MTGHHPWREVLFMPRLISASAVVLPGLAAVFLAAAVPGRPSAAGFALASVLAMAGVLAWWWIPSRPNYN